MPSEQNPPGEGPRLSAAPGGRDSAAPDEPGERGSRPTLRLAGPPPPEHADLSAPDYYLNRELTWLAFNRRVLHEAEDERTPLLERIKFLSIVSSNLDEFFMKRIGGLKQQVGAGVHDLTVDGRTPEQQIAECYDVIRRMEGRQRELFEEQKSTTSTTSSRWSRRRRWTRRTPSPSSPTSP